MITRYPKLESVQSDRNCIHLPRLCLQQKLSATESDYNQKHIPQSNCHTSRRGCDSAPVINDQHSTSFQLVFGNDSSGYPKQIRVKSNFRLSWFPAESKRPALISESSNGQMTDDGSSEVDFLKISRCLQLLQESGFYYEGLSWQQATAKLRRCRVGTFLIRESENANFLFTLSVQTKMGPTSIRIAYRSGQFRLDAEEELVHQMPTFATVLDLVEYYVRVSKQLSVKSDPTCCWLDLAGECSAPVELYQPLYKKMSSLKHLCRLSVIKQISKNEHLEKGGWTSLGLPVPLQNYLTNYPYSQ